MEPITLGTIVVSILSAPVLGKLVDAYFHRDSEERADGAKIRKELLERVEALEGELRNERVARENAQKALFDLTVEYKVLLVRFEQLEKTLERCREVSDQA